MTINRIVLLLALLASFALAGCETGRTNDNTDNDNTETPPTATYECVANMQSQITTNVDLWRITDYDDYLADRNSGIELVDSCVTDCQVNSLPAGDYLGRANDTGVASCDHLAELTEGDDHPIELTSVANVLVEGVYWIYGEAAAINRIGSSEHTVSVHTNCEDGKVLLSISGLTHFYAEGDTLTDAGAFGNLGNVLSPTVMEITGANSTFYLGLPQ